MTLHAFRGSVLHYLEDPATHAEQASEFINDALLLVEDGKIKTLAPYAELIQTLDPAVEVVDYSGKILMPGFIDLHTHYPQTEMIAAYGRQLLDWLNNYTFPTESKFSDANYAKSIAELFIDELLRNGTTTAMVFATVHKASADAFFEAASAQNLRMITGKVLMDRNAPARLCDSVDTGYTESAELIENGMANSVYPMR